MSNTNQIRSREISQIPQIEYCLYARKSSESDERQAMSIDSQVKEMKALAQKNNILIKEIRQESHSAKSSGQRSVFNQLIADIRTGLFNGILTWAPDRLSRNAGDLGMLVDLMDQEKLLQIKTFSQTFTNNPNEKFLLMILCSQAKLENDQKGLNVKRGIRAKCELGWRPGPPPIGYFNRSFAGVKDIVIDPDRGDTVTEMFRKVAEEKASGRTIKKWLDDIKFLSRSGNEIHLSMIYLMLKNPFYTGEFEYPVKSGNWYKGSYPPLINKDTFNKVQKQLITCPKPKWGEKKFDFKELFRCGSCGGGITAEEKYRFRKFRDPKHHIYYHCTKKVNPNCSEPYVSEEKLIIEILRYINFMEMAHPQVFNISEKVKHGMESYRKIRDEILLQQDIDPDKKPVNLAEYAKHITQNGSLQDKREVVRTLDRQLYIHDRSISSTLLS